MTTERIKSIGIVVATLLIGVLLGLLVPRLFLRVSDRMNGRSGMAHGNPPEQKADWLFYTIDRVVKPDSGQKEKMKPAIQWASQRIDSIEQSANSQVTSVLDSVKIKLRPILNEEQWSRLENFNARARENWRHPRGKHEKGQKRK